MGFISVAIYRRKGNKNMTTIIIKDDKDLLKIKKGDKVIDERPNNKKDQELERHIEEVENERIVETGQL